MRNAGKCNYIFLGRNSESAVHDFSDKVYGNSEEETMLGVKIGNKLPFYNYKEKMNSKAVLSRTTPFQDFLYEGPIICDEFGSLPDRNKIRP